VTQSSTFHIVYPRGDKTKLKCVELSWSCSHEINDYSVASQKTFYDIDDARVYARELAKKHGKEYVSDDNDKNDYLD
jgi:hypothetical protein